MNTYIILLRGVNVGGKNILPMKDLKAHLTGSGFENIETYIQSGNIVLQHASKPEVDITEIIKNNYDFTPDVMVLSKREFKSCVSNNPYSEYEGKFVHFYFCNEKPKVNSAKLKKLTSTTERYKLVDNVFYLHAPNGIDRSRLVAGIEACLGVSATGRNLNTINKINVMANNA